MDSFRPSLNGLVHKPFADSESWGGLGGGYGIQIAIAYTERELDDKDRWACRKHIEAIEKHIRGRTFLESPGTKATQIERRAKLVACFGDGLIYVKETANQYSDDVYFRAFPWLIVTTARGHFLIGWRKRVINLDWADTDIKANGEELFADQDVTKGKDYIHCYGYAKAAEYIQKLMAWDPTTVTEEQL